MNIRYTLPVVSLLIVVGIAACDKEAPFRKVTYGMPLVSYTAESVTMTHSEEYRYERKTLSRRIQD